MNVYPERLPVSREARVEGGIAWVKAKGENHRSRRMVSLYVCPLEPSGRWAPQRVVFSRTFLPMDTPKEELEETLAQMFLMAKAACTGTLKWGPICPKIYSKAVKDLTS